MSKNKNIKKEKTPSKRDILDGIIKKKKLEKNKQDKLNIENQKEIIKQKNKELIEAMDKLKE